MNDEAFEGARALHALILYLMYVFIHDDRGKPNSTSTGTTLELQIKKKYMNDKEKDPQLQAPQEANTGKHINFLEVEDAEGDSSANKKDNSASDDSPTKKAWEELRQDLKTGQTGKDI
ncbi:MAG: hypothetical protein JWQ40_2103 [Segetibacter sp.]|nr:hypothetical protein [Segetibacter sp.]